MNNKKDLEDIYNKLKEFHKKNSIESIIKNNCTIQKINEKKNVSLTVVFTSNNRPKQTYFTLKSWEHIALLNNINIQVVIVEDSLKDKLNISELNYDNLEITYIYIKNKTWINPCLNYNIGFEFIKSDRVVISNAEVCVFGNIYEIIYKKLNENNYLIFDVFELGKRPNPINKNTEVWEKCRDLKYETVIKYIKDKEHTWLQSKENNKNLHFLTCIHIDNLKKINGFDSDFIFNVDYDDDIFLKKVLFAGLSIVNLHKSNYNVLGLHQWHNKHSTNYYFNNNVRKYNKLLFMLKNKYMSKNKKYLQLNNFTKFEYLLDEITPTEI